MSEKARGSFEAAYSDLPPWDIGRPQGEIVRLAEEGGIRGARFETNLGPDGCRAWLSSITRHAGTP